MAKRIAIVNQEGRVVMTCSSRHTRASEEVEHCLAFAHNNMALLRDRFPDDQFSAWFVETRSGEDEAVLHSDLHRLRADVRFTPDGTFEMLGIAVSAAPQVRDRTDAVRFVGHHYPALVSKPRKACPVQAATAAMERCRKFDAQNQTDMRTLCRRLRPDDRGQP